MDNDKETLKDWNNWAQRLCENELTDYKAQEHIALRLIRAEEEVRRWSELSTEFFSGCDSDEVRYKIRKHLTLQMLQSKEKKNVGEHGNDSKPEYHSAGYCLLAAKSISHAVSYMVAAGDQLAAEEALSLMFKADELYQKAYELKTT